MEIKEVYVGFSPIKCLLCLPSKGAFFMDKMLQNNFIK